MKEARNIEGLTLTISTCIVNMCNEESLQSFHQRDKKGTISYISDHDNKGKGKGGLIKAGVQKQGV